jgi:sterol desaturase/sphingolipid hydroxylase (fatty acid hydroxylase superfamily)
VTAAEKIRLAFEAGIGIAFGDALAYVFFAGVLWLAFYVLFRRAAAGRKIVPRFPSRKQIGWEVLYSLRSTAVFGAVGVLVVYAAYSGWTRLYLQVDRYGWVWFFASIAVAVVMHDAYFYWTHRLMHDRRLFRVFHRTHHLSHNPSPWAAYCFSVGEAVVQAGIGPLVVFVIPMHPVAFSVFMTWQIGFNVFGHCGYEIFPHGFLKSLSGRFLNTPTHHAMHHQNFDANFGLYFNLWDRWMGTNDPEYSRRFDQVTASLPPEPDQGQHHAN